MASSMTDRGQWGNRKTGDDARVDSDAHLPRNPSRTLRTDLLVRSWAPPHGKLAKCLTSSSQRDYADASLVASAEELNTPNVFIRPESFSSTESSTAGPPSRTPRSTLRFPYALNWVHEEGLDPKAEVADRSEGPSPAEARPNGSARRWELTRKLRPQAEAKDRVPPRHDRTALLDVGN
jgi:hypothetical protein